MCPRSHGGSWGRWSGSSTRVCTGHPTRPAPASAAGTGGPPTVCARGGGGPQPRPLGPGDRGSTSLPFSFSFSSPRFLSSPFSPFIFGCIFGARSSVLMPRGVRRSPCPLIPHSFTGAEGTDLKRRMQAGGALGGRRGGRWAGGAAVLERSWVLQSGTLSEEYYPHTGAGPSRVSGASPALPDFP